jgi:hypothetical protein
MNVEETYRGNYADGIFFTEGGMVDAELLGKVRVESKKMNSNLAQLKVRLARLAREKGANAICQYKYGQKRTLLSIWDDTMWYAEGIAALAELNARTLE